MPIRSNLHVQIAVIILVLGQSAAVYGAQSQETEQRIQGLIRALASPNRAPKQGDGENRIPSAYGRATQEKVLDAWTALLKEGIDAFPMLVASSRDKRYSCTVRGPNGDVNLTVGDVCSKIIRNQVSVCEDVIDRPSPNAPPSHFPLGDLSDWWQKNRQRKLPDLQLEATEYALASVKKPSDGELDLTDPRIKTRHLANIQRLEAFLERLKAADQAVQPRTIEGGQRMIGLPGGDTRDSKSHPFDKDEGPANKP